MRMMTITVYRSAVTGRFVSAAYARRYPDRTVRERRRIACRPGAAR